MPFGSLSLSLVVLLSAVPHSLSLSQESLSFCGLPSTAVANAPATSLYPDGSAYKLSLSLSRLLFPLYTHTHVYCLPVCVCVGKRGRSLLGLLSTAWKPISRELQRQTFNPKTSAGPWRVIPNAEGSPHSRSSAFFFRHRYVHTHPIYTLPSHPTEHRPASGGGNQVHWEF